MPVLKEQPKSGDEHLDVHDMNAAEVGLDEAWANEMLEMSQKLHGDVDAVLYSGDKVKETVHDPEAVEEIDSASTEFRSEVDELNRDYLKKLEELQKTPGLSKELVRMMLDELKKRFGLEEDGSTSRVESKDVVEEDEVDDEFDSFESENELSNEKADTEEGVDAVVEKEEKKSEAVPEKIEVTDNEANEANEAVPLDKNEQALAKEVREALLPDNRTIFSRAADGAKRWFVRKVADPAAQYVEEFRMGFEAHTTRAGDKVRRFIPGMKMGFAIESAFAARERDGWIRSKDSLVDLTRRYDQAKAESEAIAETIKEWDVEMSNHEKDLGSLSPSEKLTYDINRKQLIQKLDKAVQLEQDLKDKIQIAADRTNVHERARDTIIDSLVSYVDEHHRPVKHALDRVEKWQLRLENELSKLNAFVEEQKKKLELIDQKIAQKPFMQKVYASRRKDVARAIQRLEDLHGTRSREKVLIDKRAVYLKERELKWINLGLKYKNEYESRTKIEV